MPPGAPIGAQRSEDGEVVRFCTAAGKHQILGSAANPTADAKSRGFHLLAGGLAVVMNGGRIAPHFGRCLRKGFDHLKRRRSGGIMVKVVTDVLILTGSTDHTKKYRLSFQWRLSLSLRTLGKRITLSVL